MNRRKFLQNTALFSMPLFLQGIPVFAGDSHINEQLKRELLSATDDCDRIFVIVQMSGGNDGLNTVIPLDKYAELNAARSNIVIPASSVLSLDGNATTGLHPSMSGIQNLYNDGKISIVQGVSYPNPSYSHFQAQDIWFSASASPQLNTGWLGRNFDANNPGFPAGYPNTNFPDPLAVQIGGALPLSLQGSGGNIAYNVPDPASLINIATASPAPAPSNDYGSELTFLRMMKDQSNAYTSRISAAYNAQATLSSMYNSSPNNSLCDQLKVVARLIGGGLKTRIYIVNHPDSFDTHTGQVSTPTTGVHANALDRLSKAITAFQNDITLMGKGPKVAGMTFSEFGRRVMSNASKGTDHGAAAPIIFFGEGVNGGMIGTSPILPTNPTTSSQVPMQYDFRQLYTTVMQRWLCTNSPKSNTILNGVFMTIPIFEATQTARENISPAASLEENYARIAFEVTENHRYQTFTIERSIDNVTFTEIAVIDNDSDDTFKRHTFLDERINTKKTYYRIKATTKKELQVISKTVALNTGVENQKMSIYPNPVVNRTINIEFFEQIKENVEINIFGKSGEKLYYDQINLGGAQKHQFRVSDMFSNNNIYIMKVNYGDTVVTEKLLFV